MDSKDFSILCQSRIKTWSEKFMSCPKNRLAQNACTKMDPFDVCQSRAKLQEMNHVFEHKVEMEGKPMTDQKNSGRCWIFAALNCMRIPFMKEYNLDDFEFSQSYLFFWDKIERSNYFLNTIALLAIAREPLDGRLMAFKLSDPINDGGQWDMLVNLVNKYGVIPKKCFPESFCSGKTIRLNTILKSKLREYASVLRSLAEEGQTLETLQGVIQKQMEEVFRIVAICLGIPPLDTFTWEYQDKAKKFHRVGPITPLNFYKCYVAKCFNVEDKVCLVTDPRKTNHYGQAYTIEWLGNVCGGRPVLYNNQPVELLMSLVETSIKAGEPVWFGCDVSKRYAMKPGLEDLLVHDFETVFGMQVQLSLDKARRLEYGESAMTHAMVFTGVSTEPVCADKWEERKVSKFRVENSWGEESGDKGYIMMSADWFKEFVYEIVVDKKHVSPEVMAVFKCTPSVLPSWDPMGTLAQ